MPIPKRRAKHQSLEELAFQHVYSGTHQWSHYLARAKRLYGNKATNAAVRRAHEVQQMMDPTFRRGQ